MPFLTSIMNGFTLRMTSLFGKLCSVEGISTLAVVLVLLLKLLINNNATALQLKALLLSIPSELTVLIVGFLISSLISTPTTTDNATVVVLLIYSLIQLVVQYASERSLEKRISGSWTLSIWLSVLLMYFFSIGLYTLVVFGGVT